MSVLCSGELPLLSGFQSTHLYQSFPCVQDLALVERCLLESGYDSDLAIVELLQLMDLSVDHCERRIHLVMNILSSFSSHFGPSSTTQLTPRSTGVHPAPQGDHAWWWRWWGW